MYQDYFGLTEDPFSITPDPKYLFLSERHRNGFAHLLYGVTEGGGFLQLTGEVGTGKTMLCRKLLEELPRAVDVAFIFNPRLSPLELVAAICDELNVLYPLGCTSIKEIVDFLNAFLLESHSRGRRTVVIIDEAQNLSFESLEQIRLLTNLETEKHKLLQIILVGQPELRTLLQQDRLRQLAQRVTARYHLTPLSRTETKAYVLHRLKVVKVQRPLFSKAALQRIYRYSGGVPRVINIICHRGLLLAYARNSRQVSGSMVKLVYQELSGLDEGSRRQLAWAWITVAILGCTLLVLLMWNADQLVRFVPTQSPPQQQAASPAVEVVEDAAATEDQPGLNRMMVSENNAFVTLFSYWQRVYPVDDETRSSCDRAEEVGLSCIYGRGSWDSLVYYNRPAVLELIMDDAQRYNVVASSLTDSEVTLDLNGRRFEFSREEIDQLWTGSYIILWRPPKLSSESLSIGNEGKDVAWLISMLDRIEGTETSFDPQHAKFDLEIQQRVKRFQRAQGLLADGIVGKQTLIQLNGSVADSTKPVLLHREG